MNLTPNFTLEELTFSETASRRGWDNTPPIGFQENLVRVAELLEQVRKIINKPITITSGYRCKNLNDAIGSKETSQHRRGAAADFKIVGMTPKEVINAIIKSGLEFDQLICEFSDNNGGGWTHISVPNTIYMKPRMEVLTIDRKGVRPFNLSS